MTAFLAINLSVLLAHGGGRRGGGGGGVADFLFPCGFFLVFILVAIVIVYLNYLWEKKRTEAMRQFADEMGFDFVATPDSGLFGEVSGLYLFEQGHSKRFGNLMRGEAGGMELRLFDYWYTTGSGKNKTTRVQTVLCFVLTGKPLPTFSLRPQSFFHTIGTWFGYQDINFESHPNFSNYYLLRGSDEEAVRELFKEEVLDHFESVKGACVEGGGDVLVYYRTGKRVAPGQLRPLMEEGFRSLSVLCPGAST